MLPVSPAAMGQCAMAPSRLFRRQTDLPVPVRFARTRNRLRSYLYIYVGLLRRGGAQADNLGLPYEALFFGAFLPFFRAFERAIAIACFRLLTSPPLPLFAVPRL